MIICSAQSEELKKGTIPDFSASVDSSFLYLFRESRFRGGFDWKIYLNDELLIIDNGAVYKVRLQEGVNDLWAPYDRFSPGYKELNVVKGKNYYLGLKPEEGFKFFELNKEKSEEIILKILK